MTLGSKFSKAVRAIYLPKQFLLEKKSAFFWLDAHEIYDFDGTEAEENPLLAEIDTVIAARDSSNTIIAINNARGMGTQPD